MPSAITNRQRHHPRPPGISDREIGAPQQRPATPKK